VDAHSATDKRIDLATLHGEPALRLGRDVGEYGVYERPGDVVQDYVEARLRNARIDDDVKAAVDAMFAGGEAERPAHVAERQWQRRFRAEVGVSPRMLQSVLRFRRVFDAIEHPETSGWVQAALRAGYFDQPQMARDFRRFLGCTAREWAAERAGLAKALTASDGYKNDMAT
jgi:transcriptional regulator GlxA family with amidase domain